MAKAKSKDVTAAFISKMRHEEKRADLAICQAFLLCQNPATTTIKNPILGEVPACQRCADKLARIGGK